MEVIHFLVVKKNQKTGKLFFLYHREEHWPCSLALSFKSKLVKDQNSSRATHCLSIVFYFILTILQLKDLVLETSIPR